MWKMALAAETARIGIQYACCAHETPSANGFSKQTSRCYFGGLWCGISMCEETCNLRKVADLAAKGLEMEVTPHSELKRRFLRRHVVPKRQGTIGLKRGVFRYDFRNCMLWQKSCFQS